MSLLLNTVLHSIQQEFRKEAPIWTDVKGGITDKEWERIDHECKEPSPFDPHHTRRQLWNQWNQGKREGILRRCAYGQVLAILDNGFTVDDIPWELWGRILRMYSTKKGERFQIYLFAIDRPRRFPRSLSMPILPEHINGGYTYPCKKDTIIIHRAEDATRVLIHELQHACCLDHHEDGIDHVEAETEAWAELLYVAFVSGGDLRQFKKGIVLQSAWMRTQNEKIRGWIGNTHAFPWRYTIGKEDIWRRWGILVENDILPRPKEAIQSLRLTASPTGDVHGIL